MVTENTSQWDKRCIVCGKNVEGGGGMCHLEYNGHMIAICCPLCMTTFKKSPESYLRRQEIAKELNPGDVFGEDRLFGD